MAERILYLPSTPFNLFVSLLDMCQQKSQRAQLVMIDQRRPLPYLSLLQDESDFPLSRVASLPAARGLVKPFQRRRLFAQLWEWARDFEPTQVVVGSDRRVEFQYVMHRFERMGRQVRGVYLDDGLYSYMAWPKGRLARQLDRLSKRLAYGRWWREPIHVGDSSWIQEARLFAPEWARPSLKEKRLTKLDGRFLMAAPIRQLSVRIAQQAGVEVERLAQAALVILMPHPHDLANLPGFEQTVRQEIAKASGPIFVKYHPRFEGRDALGLCGPDVSMLPDSVAFEFFLPLLGEHVEVVGDLTTALLSTRWMRPDMRVRALGHLDGRVDEMLLRLYRRFGVEVAE